MEQSIRDLNRDVAVMPAVTAGEQTCYGRGAEDVKTRGRHLADDSALVDPG
jgi:hypothetical protein